MRLDFPNSDQTMPRYLQVAPISTPQFQAAEKVARKLILAGYQTYLAGGWVRDLLLGKKREGDIDLATEAPVEKIQELLPKTIAVGAFFGCVIAFEENWQFEVTTFRQDGDYLDGRHPLSISAGTPMDDARRRDFTINGLFYDLSKQLVLDFVGGIDDLEKKVVRSIGDPHQRFEEDKLRLLRCVRFAAHLGFTIDAATSSAVKALATKLPSSVSKERLWQELTKLLIEDKSLCACQLLYELQLAQALTPPFPPIDPEHCELFQTLKKLPANTSLLYQLLALWIDSHAPSGLVRSSKEISDAFKTAFALSRKDVNRLDLWLAMQNQAHLETSAKNQPGRSDQRLKWWSLYSNLMAEECSAALFPIYGETFQKEQALLHQELKPHIARKRNQKPLVNAALLMTCKIAAGPELGKWLHRAEILAVERDLKTSDQVLKHLFEGF